MIRPPFFIIFSLLFWIAYSLRHKSQLWPWPWIKGTDEFFQKIYKKKLADWFKIKRFKWWLSIFVWTGANLKIIEKNADLWSAKNWRLIWPKKIFFFWLFTLRRLESVFQDEKKNFFLNSSNFFYFFDGKHQSDAVPAVITIRQKVQRDIFNYNVEKFKLLA